MKIVNKKKLITFTLLVRFLANIYFKGLLHTVKHEKPIQLGFRKQDCGPLAATSPVWEAEEGKIQKQMNTDLTRPYQTTNLPCKSSAIMLRPISPSTRTVRDSLHPFPPPLIHQPVTLSSHRKLVTRMTRFSMWTNKLFHSTRHDILWQYRRGNRTLFIVKWLKA